MTYSALVGGKYCHDVVQCQLRREIQVAKQLQQNDNALFLAERLYSINKSEENAQALAECYFNVGEEYRGNSILQGFEKPHSRFVRAQCLNKMKKYNQAVQVLEEGKVPHGAYGLYLLGRLYRVQGMEQEAIQRYCQAVQLNPLLWTALTELKELGAIKEVQMLVSRLEAGVHEVDNQATNLATSQHCNDSLIQTSNTSIQRDNDLNGGDDQACRGGEDGVSAEGEGGGMEGVVWGTVSTLGDDGGQENAVVTGADDKCERESQPQHARSRTSAPPYRLSSTDLPLKDISQTPHNTTQPQQQQQQAILREDRQGGAAESGRDGRAWNNSNPDIDATARPDNASAQTRFQQRAYYQRNGEQCALPHKSHQQAADNVVHPPTTSAVPGPSGADAGYSIDHYQAGVLDTDDLDGFEAVKRGEGGLRCRKSCIKQMLPIYTSMKFNGLKAVTALQQLDSNQANSCWIQCQIAYHYYYEQMREESRDVYEYSRQLDPLNLKGLEYYSFLLRIMRDKVRLATLAAEGLTINTHMPQPWHFLANLHSALGQHEQAVSHLDTAIKVCPTFSPAWEAKGYELLSLEEFEGAMAAFTHALQLCGGHNQSARYGMARIYYRQEKWSVAEANVRKALDLRPGFHVFLRLLGNMHLARGERESMPQSQELFKKAREAFKRAVSGAASAGASERCLCHWGLARASRSLGRLDDAADQFRVVKTLSLRPEINLLYEFGCVLRDLGRHQEALIELQTAQALSSPGGLQDKIKSSISELARLVDGEMQGVDMQHQQQQQQQYAPMQSRGSDIHSRSLRAMQESQQDMIPQQRNATDQGVQDTTPSGNMFRPSFLD